MSCCLNYTRLHKNLQELRKAIHSKDLNTLCKHYPLFSSPFICIDCLIIKNGADSTSLNKEQPALKPRLKPHLEALRSIALDQENTSSLSSLLLTDLSLLPLTARLTEAEKEILERRLKLVGAYHRQKEALEGLAKEAYDKKNGQHEEKLMRVRSEERGV
jgi:hypothetical protein